MRGTSETPTPSFRVGRWKRGTGNGPAGGGDAPVRLVVPRRSPSRLRASASFRRSAAAHASKASSSINRISKTVFSFQEGRRSSIPNPFLSPLQTKPWGWGGRVPSRFAASGPGASNPGVASAVFPLWLPALFPAHVPSVPSTWGGSVQGRGCGSRSPTTTPQAEPPCFTLSRPGASGKCLCLQRIPDCRSGAQTPLLHASSSRRSGSGPKGGRRAGFQDMGPRGVARQRRAGAAILADTSPHAFSRRILQSLPHQGDGAPSRRVCRPCGTRGRADAWDGSRVDLGRKRARAAQPGTCRVFSTATGATRRVHHARIHILGGVRGRHGKTRGFLTPDR